MCFFFFSSRRRHTRLQGDWSSDVCSSDLADRVVAMVLRQALTVATIGAVLGGLIAIAAGVVIQAQLFGVPGVDVRTLGGSRSEERRVGKESRKRGGAERETKRRSRMAEES